MYVNTLEKATESLTGQTVGNIRGQSKSVVRTTNTSMEIFYWKYFF